jgi:UDP-glucose 4-epimerase
MQVNVVGTQNLLEACRLHPPRRLVLASTAAIYPIAETAHSEEDEPGPMDIYGLSKWINEKQLALFAQPGGTRCAVARLFNVIGLHETNPHVVPEILDQMLQGQDDLALGNTQPKRDYVFVTDVADALLLLADKNHESYRIFNVGTGQEHSVEEIVRQLAAVTGRPLRIKETPGRMRPSDRMHLLCNRRRITQELGWHPRYTLASGLKALWESIQQTRQLQPAGR